MSAPSTLVRVRAALRQPQHHGLSRDTAVQCGERCVYHVDSVFVVDWNGTAAVLLDEAGEPWTLRRFASRHAAFDSHLSTEHSVVLYGYVDVAGVRVEFSGVVDLWKMTAEIAV